MRTSTWDGVFESSSSVTEMRGAAGRHSLCCSRAVEFSERPEFELTNVSPRRTCVRSRCAVRYFDDPPSACRKSVAFGDRTAYLVHIRTLGFSVPPHEMGAYLQVGETHAPPSGAVVLPYLLIILFTYLLRYTAY